MPPHVALFFNAVGSGGGTGPPMGKYGSAVPLNSLFAGFTSARDALAPDIPVGGWLRGEGPAAKVLVQRLCSLSVSLLAPVSLDRGESFFV
jgi:hypothetical protein